MDELQLEEAIDRLVLEGHQKRAEEMLLPAYEDAKRRGDVHALDLVLKLLVFVEGSAAHPDMGRLEGLCIEREKNKSTTYDKLQTAMILFDVAKNYVRSTKKLVEVIESGRKEGDSSSVYSALGLLGRSLLALDRKEEAAEVLHQVERMIAAKGQMVIGDETTFLEGAYEKGLELATVKRIASVAAPLCNDQDFRNRLNALASSRA